MGIYYNFVHRFVVSWSLFKFYVTLFYAVISALYHRFKAVTPFKAQEGVLRISRDGDNQLIFSGFKGLISGFFGAGKFGKYFFSMKHQFS